MRIALWTLLLACIKACCYQPVKARPFLILTQKNKAARIVSQRRKIDAFAQHRGGDVITKEPRTLVDILFDPRVALKTLSVSLGCFGAELLLFPVMFRDTFFLKNAQGGLNAGGSSSATDFLQYLLGIRELLLAILFWKSAQDGTDEMCRLLVTISFWTMSMPQMYYIIRHNVFKNAQIKQFIIKLYGFFFLLNGVVMLKSWYQKSQEATKV